MLLLPLIKSLKIQLIINTNALITIFWKLGVHITIIYMYAYIIFLENFMFAGDLDTEKNETGYIELFCYI